MKRETQLRAFYSTTEEISALFVKQQEQLKAMQRTLEDEENLSVDIDLYAIKGNTKDNTTDGEKAKSHRSNNNVKESSAASTPRVDRIQIESTCDEASVTERHKCDFKSQEGGHDTQDQECTSGEHAVKGGFGSDINGIDTAPILEADPIETERVLGTESPANFVSENIDLNKLDTLMGDTMQLDTYAQEDDGVRRVCDDSARCSQSNKLPEFLKAMEDTEPAAATIQAADLLASEVAGSWAISTSPSVHGENGSPRSGERDGGGNDVDDDDGDATRALLRLSDGQADASQTIPATTASTKCSQERQALNAMIVIVAPEFKGQFGGDGSIKGRNSEEASISESDTEDGNGDDGVDAKGGSISDADTQEGSDDPGDRDNQANDRMDECDDATQEDSLG